MEQLARLDKTFKVARDNIALIIHITTTYAPKMRGFWSGALETADVGHRNMMLCRNWSRLMVMTISAGDKSSQTISAPAIS